MLRQTAEISKAINPGAVSISPAGLQCITADKIESEKLEALVGVVHMRTHNLTEYIRLAAASRARTRAPQQFKFQKRFRAVIPSNGQFVSDLLDIAGFKSHHRQLTNCQCARQDSQKTTLGKTPRCRKFPSTKSQRNSNLQQSNPIRQSLLVWNLLIGASLVLGIWDLVIRPQHRV